MSEPGKKRTGWEDTTPHAPAPVKKSPNGMDKEHKVTRTVKPYPTLQK